MIKSILLFINLLGFLLCKLLFTPAVDVSQSMPFSAAASASFMVQVAINKGDVKGFGKFSEKLPAGFNAVPQELQGAKASFTPNPQGGGYGGTIEFSWDSLPSDGIINISFRVDLAAGVPSGKDTMKGQFLYTTDNQKMEADAMPSYINITGSTYTAPKGGNIIDTMRKCNGGVCVTRRLPASSVPPNSDAVVTLKIQKSNLKGFGKIEENLPDGFSAAGIDLKGASFTFIDNTAKFVWQNLPSDTIVTISYRLIAGSNVSGTVTISGSFYYLIDNTPTICSAGTTIFNTTTTTGSGQPAITSTKPAITPTQPAITPAQPVVKQSKPEVSQETASKPVENPVQVTPSIPSPQTGVNYRVQLMALHNAVDVSYFSGKRRIDQKVYTEQLEGFTKYTVGSYTDYKSVRDARDGFKSRGIEGPFVVSYNSGVRITVQEALMITHQQWYK